MDYAQIFYGIANARIAKKEQFLALLIQQQAAKYDPSILREKYRLLQEEQKSIQLAEKSLQDIRSDLINADAKFQDAFIRAAGSIQTAETNAAARVEASNIGARSDITVANIRTADDLNKELDREEEEGRKGYGTIVDKAKESARTLTGIVDRPESFDSNLRTLTQAFSNFYTTEMLGKERDISTDLGRATFAAGTIAAARDYINSIPGLSASEKARINPAELAARAQGLTTQELEFAASNGYRSGLREARAQEIIGTLPNQNAASVRSGYAQIREGFGGGPTTATLLERLGVATQAEYDSARDVAAKNYADANGVDVESVKKQLQNDPVSIKFYLNPKNAIQEAELRGRQSSLESRAASLGDIKQEELMSPSELEALANIHWTRIYGTKKQRAIAEEALANRERQGQPVALPPEIKPTPPASESVSAPTDSQMQSAKPIAESTFTMSDFLMNIGKSLIPQEEIGVDANADMDVEAGEPEQDNLLSEESTDIPRRQFRAGEYSADDIYAFKGMDYDELNENEKATVNGIAEAMVSELQNLSRLPQDESTQDRIAELGIIADVIKGMDPKTDYDSIALDDASKQLVKTFESTLPKELRSPEAIKAVDIAESIDAATELVNDLTIQSKEKDISTKNLAKDKSTKLSTTELDAIEQVAAAPVKPQGQDVDSVLKKIFGEKWDTPSVRQEARKWYTTYTMLS